MNDLRKYFANEIRQRCLSVSALEREAGMPKKTLAHFLKGRRGMSEKHIKRLKEILKNFGFSDKPDIYH
jgi:predicted transcriptional regulator